jgi:hypothetical protein
MQIELNKCIVAARDANSILAIVEAEHGAFNAVNAATACNRLAKTRQGSSHGGLRTDDRRVQALLSTVTRVAANLGGQQLANTVWSLATLGWQGGEGSMRCALEAAAVRLATSINAQGGEHFVVFGDARVAGWGRVDAVCARGGCGAAGNEDSRSASGKYEVGAGDARVAGWGGVGVVGVAGRCGTFAPAVEA